MSSTDSVRAASSAEKRQGSRIGVLVVDDHPAIRDAIKDTISSKMDMHVVGEAESGYEAFRVIEKQHPDVAIVDISLKDGHGLDLVQNIRIQYPDVHVVVFSMYDESVYAERAIRAGASSYLMKSESTQVVVDAIRTVMRGEIYLSRHMASKILSKVAVGRSASPGFAIDELTDREMSVFQMLGQGHSVEEITDRLSLSRKTVETYRRRAKEKLGFETVAELLQYAVQWTHAQGERA